MKTTTYYIVVTRGLVSGEHWFKREEAEAAARLRTRLTGFRWYVREIVGRVYD